MLLYVWVALGIAVVAVAGAFASAVTRGLQAWRALARFRRKALEAVDDLNERLAAVDRNVARAGDSAVRLQRAQADLQASLAGARVLASGLSEFRAVLAYVTGLVPSK